MKISEIAKLLPRLGSFDRDIESWAEEFNRVMELSDIDDPRKMFAWAKECVPGRLKGVIEDLKEEDEEAEMIIYPSITDIKTAIEKFLDITPQEKCFNLKSLKIQKGESIKDFNWRYGKLYGSLTPESQAFITINDYTDSLLSRPYARKEVITSQPANLEEAFKIAELAETASEMPNRNRNVVMFTNTYGGLNSIFPNNYSNNYNNRNYDNPNNYEYNNYRSNYNNYNYNNYNNYNKNNGYNHSNNYNNNYRNSYNNNYNNSINNRNINHFRNGYNSGNNYNNNNPNFNNMNNNFSNNKVPGIKNNLRNQNFMSNNINLNCFKCHQPGHRMQDCPYTYQELADMEATGRLNNNNLYITNNSNTNRNHNLNNNNNYNSDYNINNLNRNSNINTNNANHYNSNGNFNVNTNYNNTSYNSSNPNHNNIDPINNNQNFFNNNNQPLNF